MGETMTINSLADVRPGDLCFTRIGGLVPGVFPVAAGMLACGERVRIGRLRFDHVIVVTEPAYVSGGPVGGDSGGAPARDPRGVQAMPSGAERVELTEAKHWNAWTAYCRLPEEWPGQARDAAAIAELMAEARIPYSFASYAALALWRYGVDTPRLTKWIDRRRPGAITLPRWSNGPESASDPRRRGGQLPAEAICSVLADQAWSLAGKRVIEGVSPQAVTPGRLGMQLWRRPGVIWGGPGILG
jgi:hypothetical protein